MALVAGVLGLVPTQLPSATAAGQSISTTTNVTASTGNGQCLNPNDPADPVNCNQFADREDVWLSNLPTGLGDGDYFLAVTAPGAQPDPNDGSPDLLSTDSHLDRAFRVQGGVVSSLGTHLVENQRVQLFPYAETPNGGGVYIATVCRLADYPVEGSDCTHDAFKVGDPDPLVAVPPAIVKDADGAYDRTYGWTITKVADKETVQQTGGSVTVTYDVTVTHDAGPVSGVVVSGTISVFNPNAATMVADVTDQLSDGTVCAVTGGAGAVLQPGDNDFAYSCALASLPQAQLDNTAQVSWADQVVGQAPLAGGMATFVFDGVGFTETTIDECVDVTDTVPGALGSVCVGGANPTGWEYERILPVETPGCVDYDNTATYVTNDTGTSDSADATVTVCKVPLGTGAKTIGFWQNKNGQGVIANSAATGGVCNVGTYLRTFAPFKNLSASATCAQVATWVKGTIGQATASTMNAMLKAQMLASALNVHFTGPGSTAATRKFIPKTVLGGVLIDLTTVWGNQDVSQAFGGATTMKVSAMLTYAAGQSNNGGSVWYGNVKSVQGKAKNAFDAINNQAVYAP
ncbi:hypothetical protein GCM10025786_13340 [Nocardioides caeni]